MQAIVFVAHFAPEVDFKTSKRLIHSFFSLFIHSFLCKDNKAKEKVINEKIGKTGFTNMMFFNKNTSFPFGKSVIVSGKFLSVYNEHNVWYVDDDGKHFTATIFNNKTLEYIREI